MTSSNASGRLTALVTGASSGIGLAFAGTLASHGHDLVLVARDRARLEAAATNLRREQGIDVRIFVVDLSEPGAAERVWAVLEKGGVEIDILVNNAGSGLYGPFHDQSPEDLRRMQMVNVVALTSLTRLALPAMRSRRRGWILNVASIVGYQPGGPGMSAYYATKSYVLSLSKGLALELAGSGVSVTALCPGVTASAFEERAGAGATRLYRLLPQLAPEAVARAGYRALMKRRSAVVPGLSAKILAIAGELPPRVIALLVNRWLLRSSRGAAG
jgi:short-subunit dehydrogenase